MSLQLDPQRTYMMPVFFGPCVTPRQGRDGQRCFYDDPTHLTKYDLVYEADPQKIEAILPKGFQLESPYVIMTMKQYRDVSWLAGFGYNLVSVQVPVTYTGKERRVSGQLMLVLWEGHPDPVITGREQLGYNKIFAEIADISTYHGISRTFLSSWGFRFLDLEFHTKNQPENKDELLSVLQNPKDEGLLHYKYIPKTGRFTESEIEYVTFGPKFKDVRPEMKDYPPAVTEYMSGTITWHKPRWEDMPTQHMIVETFIDWGIKRFVGVQKVISYNFDDLHHMQIIE